MRTAFTSSTSRIALAASILCGSSAANAAPFTIVDGQTVTTQQTVSGSDQGSIAAGGALNVTGAAAILWNGAANAPGINIVNNGLVQSSTRAIDATGAISGVFTLQNNGEITSANDTFRINAALTNSTVTVTNTGLMSSQTGQVFDFAAITATNNVVRVVNSGIIRSATADAVRPGANGTVINSGLIEATDLTQGGDGVDFQGAGGTVQNLSGGQIIGAKHGVTGDGVGGAEIDNAAGGLIAGRNGSGVNFDTSGADIVTITNRGTIRGAATASIDDDGPGGVPDGVPDGDGDGVDVDGQVVVNNFGTIQGTGASGTKDGVANTADGIAAGGGQINNFAGGVIEAFDTVGGGTGRAILIDDSAQGAAPFATTIVNQGTIRSDGVAITLIGAQNDTIDNAGLISSGEAVGVDMGDGNDTFIQRVGGQVVGAVTGGAGSDTLALAGTGGTFALGQLGDASAYRFFETLSVTSGSSYTATGTSAFTGAVNVAGALALNGSLSAASATVTGTGTLSGTGTIGSLAVQSGGAVAPGTGSVGTLNVTNTASFAAGSTYRVDVVGATADRIVVGGTATLGGAVAVTPVDVRIDDTFQILSAGTVTGVFSGVTAPSMLFATPILTYGATNVTLGFTRNAVAFESVAGTRNQRSVAQALDSAGLAGSDLVALIGGATQVGAFRNSLDLLSGEGYASLGTTMFAQNMLVADTVMSRLRQAAAGQSGGQTAALAVGGPALAYASEPTRTAAFDDLKAPYAQPVSAGPVIATWAQGFGQWSKADGRNGSAKVDGSLGGFMAGADVTSDGLTFGLAGGYVSADSDVDALRSKVDADTALVAAYAGAAIDAFRLRGGASYGWTDIDSRRTAIAGAVTERPKASYDGSTANAFAEAAYVVALDAARIEPFAQLAWSRIDTDGFNERNAPVSGLSVRGLDFDTVYTTLGARFATTLETGSGVVTPHAALAWRHAMDDITPKVAASFRAGGGDFTAAGAPIGKDSALVEAGVDVGLSENAFLGVSYEGQFASEAHTNAVKGRFAYRF
jgi:outer membrane autotransporter protein